MTLSAKLIAHMRWFATMAYTTGVCVSVRYFSQGAPRFGDSHCTGMLLAKPLTHVLFNCCPLYNQIYCNVQQWSALVYLVDAADFLNVCVPQRQLRLQSRTPVGACVTGVCTGVCSRFIVAKQQRLMSGQA